ncbi:MAG TPA: tetratricopeptide repeat protein [Pyrinomonadaceae bacterium]|jgi:tetratricopeptide (TPR) repeat protein|nr:tetratricopeptide repeat protein [Pyrinomonadaceae bacterium]
MQTTCPSCGADIFPGARFCRRCGAPLHAPGGETGDVSPNAATVPLVPDEPRTTDGLVPGEERVAQPTSRVSLAEMERILRGQEDGGRQHSHPTDPEATLVSRGPAVTRPNLPGYEDEELTINVPRPAHASEPGNFEATIDLEATQLVDPEVTIPAGVGSWPYGRTTGAETHEPTADGVDVNADGDGSTPHSTTGTVEPASLPMRSGVTPAPTRRAWPAVVAVCVAVAVLASGGAWLAYRLLYRPPLTDLTTQRPTAPVTGDAKQQFELKLEEAEAMLAAGDMEGALNRLREANVLDPGNTSAHRRLGDLLLSTGARREAIEEFRALARNAPYDFNAWRLLATTQFAEGLYNDAAESYRRVLNLNAPGAPPDPNDLLSLADALRLAGRVEEARAAYEQLAASAPADLAEVARQHLAELAPAHTTPTPQPTPRTGEPTPAPRGEEIASARATPAPQPAPVEPTPPPTPTPAPPAPASPAERYGRGVQLWASNRGAALDEFRAAAAGGNIDAHYYLGLAYVEGRKAGSLQRAEVVAALQHFQLAQRGQYAAQARAYVQQLEKEFDRLRRQ